jgi:hypothetical protein
VPHNFWGVEIASSELPKRNFLAFPNHSHIHREVEFSFVCAELMSETGGQCFYGENKRSKEGLHSTDSNFIYLAAFSAAISAAVGSELATFVVVFLSPPEAEATALAEIGALSAICKTRVREGRVRNSSRNLCCRELWQARSDVEVPVLPPPAYSDVYVQIDGWRGGGRPE